MPPATMMSSIWKQFPRYWPFVRGIQRLPVDSPQNGQWRGALMFSLLSAWKKRLSKRSRRLWFATPSRSLWCHCNGTAVAILCRLPYLCTGVRGCASDWSPETNENKHVRKLWKYNYEKHSRKHRGIIYEIINPFQLLYWQTWKVFV